MYHSPIDKLLACIRQAPLSRYRLVLIIGTSGSGKTTLLRNLSQQLKAPLINVSLELSKKMLDLTERQRVLGVASHIDQLIDWANHDIVLLDNLEILLEPSLARDPLKLLKLSSRNHTIVAAWPGSIEDGYLTYAAKGHREYRHYPLQGFCYVDLMGKHR